MIAAIEQLSAAMRETVYGEFERVDQLADEVGEQALPCAFSNPNGATQFFEDIQGAHERALQVLIHDEDAFRRAEEIRFSEYYRNSRLWDGFLVPKGLSVSLDHDEHNGADPLTQVTVYVEGLPESVVEFGGNGLGRHVQRPAIEVALTSKRSTCGAQVLRIPAPVRYAATAASRSESDAAPCSCAATEVAASKRRFWPLCAGWRSGEEDNQTRPRQPCPSTDAP